MSGATWRIVADGNWLHVRYGGVVDAAALRESFSEILIHPAWDPHRDRVFDLSGIDRFDAASFQAGEISERWRKALPNDPEASGRIVIVAADDVTFAMHRMYGIFRGLPEDRLTVVRTLDEACDFLGLERGSLLADG